MALSIQHNWQTHTSLCTVYTHKTGRQTPEWFMALSTHKKLADIHQSGLWRCLHNKTGKQTPEWFMALSTQQNWQTNTRVVYDAVYITKLAQQAAKHQSGLWHCLYNKTGRHTPKRFIALSTQQNWQTNTRVIYGAVYTTKLADKHQSGLWRCLHNETSIASSQTSEWFMALYTQQNWQTNTSGLWHCLHNKTGRQTPEWFMALFFFFSFGA